MDSWLLFYYGGCLAYSRLSKMSLVIFKTVFSNMMIEENNGKITKILFTKRKLKSTKNSNLLKAKKEILEYLNQQRMRFSFLIEPSGTDFQKKVWKQISRAVGNACGANPCLLIIPCHRVISKSGNIGGFSSFGGIVQKDRLLSLEVN